MRIADAEIRIRSQGHKATQGNLQKIGKQLLGFIGIAYAVRSAFRFFSEGITGALEYSESLTKVKSVLATTGGIAGITAEEIEALAQEMQNVTGISNTMILKAEGIMLTFTQISSEVFPQAMMAAADMSQMFGQDLQQSVIQLGTALNDPIAGVGRLKRIGISFTETQREMIKEFVAQNDIMSAQKVILDELGVEFGGVAEAVGQTLPGKLKILRASLDDIKKGFGAGILSSGLFLNTVTAMTDGVVASGKTMEENIATFVKGGLDNIVLFVNSSIAMLIKIIGSSIGLVEMFVVGFMEVIAKSFSWVLDMAIKTTEKMNSLLPGFVKVSTKEIEELKKAVDGFAVEATHDIGVLGVAMVDFAEEYEEASIDIKATSSQLGVDLSGGLTPAQQKIQDIIDEFNNMKDAATGVVNDVVKVAEAVEKLEKRVGINLSGTITTIGNLLSKMSDTVSRGIMDQTEEIVTASITSLTKNVGLVMSNPQAAGIAFNWESLGSNVGFSIYDGLHASFTGNAHDWGKTLAKILFDIAMKKLMDMIPGGSFLSGLFSSIGRRFGFSAPIEGGQGQTIIINNVNAFDVGSFSSYMKSFPVALSSIQGE